MSVRQGLSAGIILLAASSAAPLASACFSNGAYIPCCMSDVSMHADLTIPFAPTTFAATPAVAASFASRNMQLMSNVPLAQMGGGVGSSLYGWVDPLTNHEYAIMGRSNGTAFIDITNPTSPRYVANLPLAPGSVATDWREPKVMGNYAYIGVDRTSAPMQVLDLTKLRQYDGTTMTLSPNSTFTDVTKIHTIAVNKDSGYLY